MSGKRVWTPNLKFNIISNRVEKLRRKYHSLQQLPVDIDSFMEFDCGIEIIPFSGLRDRIGAEAMISMDYSSIYVDNESYMNEKFISRMKFSIAHEIGHMVLHKDFFKNQNISSEEDWISLMENIQLKYGFLENQANNFAGILLVQAEQLIAEINKNPRPTFAMLTRKFAVSTEVIKRRLSHPDLQECVSKLT